MKKLKLENSRVLEEASRDFYGRINGWFDITDKIGMSIDNKGM